VRRARHGKDAGPLECFIVRRWANVVDNPELAESNSTCTLWAAGVAVVVAELRDDFGRLKAILWTWHVLAYLVVRVLHASDMALYRANFLQIVKADFHCLRHLVVEAEVVVGLNNRVVLLARR
jgi:hypothetical protein